MDEWLGNIPAEAEPRKHGEVMVTAGFNYIANECSFDYIITLEPIHKITNQPTYLPTD
jgi:hypothetical protein